MTYRRGVPERGRDEEPVPREQATAAGLPRDLLELQRAAGNQAVGRMLARYARIDAGSAVTADTTPGAQAPFTLMSTDLTIADRPDGKPGQGIGYDRQTPASPPLNVAEDGSLAIDALAGEAKEFYARPDALTHANQRLQKVGSPIELLPGGSTVTPSALPRGGVPQALTIVRPHRRDSPPDTGFMELASDVCRDAARDVLGGLPQVARLGPEGAATYAPATSASNQRIGGTHQLAEAMTADDLAPGAAKRAMSGEDRSEPGEAYGTALASGALDDRAHDLGVNQYARAHIGEAYVTQSISNADESAKDRSQGGVERDNVWYYHFGAVVAESLDGADQILLENYRRADEVQARQNELLERLKTTYAEQLNGIALTANDPQRAIGEILHTLEHGTPPAAAEQATAAFEAMRAERLGSQLATWYFRMTGAGAGHSFHEQMAASNAFYNPLTLVVSPTTTASNIYFDEGTVTPTSTGTNNIKRLVSDLLHEAARGRRRRVRLVGHTSRQRWWIQRAMTKGEEAKRAEFVRDRLVEAGVPVGDIDVEAAEPGKRDMVEVFVLE